MSQRNSPVKLRMPDDIRDWFYLEAKKNNRSLSQEITFYLQGSLSKEYLPQAVALFKRRVPTKLNDEGLGIRFDTDLKESLRNFAKINGNSLNQEMVMRLYFTKKYAQADPVLKKVVNKMMVNEDATIYNDEDMSLIKLFSTLSDKNKNAVTNLIRNLSD